MRRALSTATAARLDRNLQQLFDKPPVSAHAFARETAGLFGYSLPPTRTPWTSAARASAERARRLAARVAASPLSLTATVKLLDALSDELCSVLDVTELVLNVHPAKDVVRDAAEANALLTSFMNELNTDVGLYQALKDAMDRVTYVNEPQPSEQTKTVAELLMRDFQKSGIHLSGNDRRKFVAVSDDILSLGNRFVRACSQFSCESVEVENGRNRLLGVDERLVKQLTKQGQSKTAIIPIDNSVIPAMILKTARDEDVRRIVYLAMNSSNEEALWTVEEMLRKRAELAKLLGKVSYAQLWLSDKMARSPETVMRFLTALSAENKPLAIAEVGKLQDIKRAHGRTNNSQILAWDELFYSQFLNASVANTTPASAVVGSLRAYFSVGTVIAGISALLQRLYGLRLEPATALPGETWHADVRKVHIVHEDEGVVGVVYLDLFARSDGDGAAKFDGAAQFTVRCSRRVDDYEEFCGERRSGLRAPDSEVVRIQDGRATLYQLPIVVLVTQFDRPASTGVPCLLGLNEVETLFHEMGHVMHSVMARTDYQHISGTRCALDFVEVPSNFLQSFARDDEVLASIGTHYSTGEKVPIEMIRNIRARHDVLESVEKQKQIKMAVLDQMYHSAEQMESVNFDTTRMLRSVQNEIHVIPYAEGTHWQTQFSHLFSYGASYYSYFWARRVSDALRDRMFSGLSGEDSLREGGEVIKNELLQWGGGRDPWVGLGKAGIDIDDLSRHINQ
ncbi:Mitochondrial intermediate peptidase [Entophlyctis sp. JEL0112]|nr:Mitochondrial intermediate peptidase [Entophlyctis sp. JEL0112]